MSRRDGAAEIRCLVAEAEDVTLEPPRPLMRDLPPADPYPIDALGDVLAPAARAIHDRVQAPLGIGAQSVLGAAALAVQGHADVVLPIGPGQARPVSCYLITVAASGERKSACDTEALWPVRKYEAAMRDRHDMDMPSCTNDKIAWDRARDEAVKRGKGDRAAIKAALDRLGPPPAVPLHPMLTCPEPTFEGLCRLFTIGWPSLGIFAAEGGQFIGGHGMSQDNRLKTAAALSSLWDGEPIRRVRAGDGAAVLPGRRVSMHLMTQPVVADIWLGDRLLADQGLLSRLLLSSPDSAMGTRICREGSAEADRAIARYAARILAILEAPLPITAGKLNELTPRRLALSDGARRVWVGFANHIEAMLGPDGELRAIAGMANKLPEHAARVAGVLTLVRDIGAGEIAVAEMAAGVELAQHYAAEALRLEGGSRVSADLRLAQRALDWLLREWTEPAISLPDLYQRGPSAIRDAAAARKIMVILEEHGRLVRIAEGAVIAGERRREAWRIVRG
jgi:Protein of unknown function (DUF3987)